MRKQEGRAEFRQAVPFRRSSVENRCAYLFVGIGEGQGKQSHPIIYTSASLKKSEKTGRGDEEGETSSTSAHCRESPPGKVNLQRMKYDFPSRTSSKNYMARVHVADLFSASRRVRVRRSVCDSKGSLVRAHSQF